MSGRFSKSIRDNAETLRRLKSRVDETFSRRDESPARRREWEKACESFHATWDGLAFPGGYRSALTRIAEGERNAVEAAICFLECRPYFFRSGYMYSRLMKLAKRATLTDAQDARLDAVAVRDEIWRIAKRSGQDSPEMVEFVRFLKEIGYDPPNV